MGFFSFLGGSKPKRIKATQEERNLLAIGKAEYGTYRQKYAPLLKELVGSTENYSPGNVLRGRAGADTAQAFRGGGYGTALDATSASKRLQTLDSQMGVAATTALGAVRTNQVGALSLARGEQSDIISGLGTAARIATSSRIGKFNADQAAASAKHGAVLGLGADVIRAGVKNRDRGGTFWTPKGGRGR